jgi:hypothetical protein
LRTSQTPTFDGTGPAERLVKLEARLEAMLMFVGAFEATELCINAEEPTDVFERIEGILVCPERDERASDSLDDASDEVPDILVDPDPP